MASVDYEKAFDYIEHWAIKKELDNAAIDYRYKNLINYIYKSTTATIRLHEDAEPIRQEGHLTRGHNIYSPNYSRLHWSAYSNNSIGQRRA